MEVIGDTDIGIMHHVMGFNADGCLATAIDMDIGIIHTKFAIYCNFAFLKQIVKNIFLAGLYQGV